MKRFSALRDLLVSCKFIMKDLCESESERERGGREIERERVHC